MESTPETFGYAADESVLGNILVVTSKHGLVGSFANQPSHILLAQARRRFPGHFTKDTPKAKQALAAALKTLANPSKPFKFPFDMRTTPFRQKVWEAILTVPPAEFSTYRDIAQLAGSPRAMRAVGSACTNNDFMWIIPCHRVLHTHENFNTKNQSARRRHALIQREVPYVKKP